MVQLTLPKNSTIRTGKTWPKPEGATNLRKVAAEVEDPPSGKTLALLAEAVDLRRRVLLGELLHHSTNYQRQLC